MRHEGYLGAIGAFIKGAEDETGLYVYFILYISAFTAVSVVSFASKRGFISHCHGAFFQPLLVQVFYRIGVKIMLVVLVC